MGEQQLVHIKEKDEIKWKIKKLTENEEGIQDIKIFTIEELKNDFNLIPEAKGVYFIIGFGNMPITFSYNTEFIQTKYMAKNIIYPPEKLEEKYNKGDRTILYIGKAQRENGLRKRLKEYIKYGYGNSTPHRGGRAIWQIDNNKQLGVCWIKTDDAEGLEKNLLIKYKEVYGTLPVANKKI